MKLGATERTKAGAKAEPVFVEMSLRHFRLGLIALLVSIAGFYARTPGFEYVDWDDYNYVLENEELGALSIDQVRTESARFVMGNYHPVTMLSYAVEILVAGKHPGLMHATNVALHMVNTWLVALLVLGLTERRIYALLTAALWSLHPMRVESVAWISGRKDLLMLLFGLLMLLAYLRWLRSQRLSWLVTAHLMFLLACSSKAMAVALVPTLFLLDHWLAPREGVWHKLKDKLLFIGLALGCGLLAVKAQADLGVIANVEVSMWDRGFAGGTNLVIYTVQQLIPVNLSTFYPYPLQNGGLPEWYRPLGLAAVVLIFFTIRGIWRRRIFWLAAAFMTINLVLVLQWLPVGQAIRADRYTYIAGIGHALMVVWCVVEFCSRAQRPDLAAVAATAVVLIATCIPTYGRIAAWRDSVAVRTDMIDHSPQNFVFYMDRANSLARIGRLDEALRDLNTAVRYRPSNDYMPYFNRGGFFVKKGEYRKAMADFLEVYKRVPTHPGLVPNMLYAQRKLGMCAEVERNATAALRMDPLSIDILNIRALCRSSGGEADSAQADIVRSLKVDGRNPNTLIIAAMLSVRMGDTATACAQIARLDTSMRVDVELDSLRQALRRSCPDPLITPP